MSKGATSEKLFSKSFCWNKNRVAENKNPVDFYSKISRILGDSRKSDFQKNSFQLSAPR